MLLLLPCLNGSAPRYITSLHTHARTHTHTHQKYPATFARVGMCWNLMFHVPNDLWVIVPFLIFLCSTLHVEKSAMQLTFSNPYWMVHLFHSSYIVMHRENSCGMAEYTFHDGLINCLIDGPINCLCAIFMIGPNLNTPTPIFKPSSDPFRSRTNASSPE